MTSPDEAASRDGVPLRGAQLEPGWELGPDGVYFRRGARVILIDPDDRVLMVRGHDVDEPGRSWWFTVGGGIDPGESARQAARRELFEETGLRIVEAALVGPVIRRSAVFDFLRQHVRQDEEFFLARIDDPGELNRDGWTDTERDFVDEVRWWDLDELGRVPEEVFPHGFVDLVRPLLAGWDGTVRHLADAP